MVLKNLLNAYRSLWRGVGSDDDSTASCVDWATIKFGSFTLLNNTWGSQYADGSYKQCISTFVDEQGKKIASWNWSWPSGNLQVKAYPQVVYANTLSWPKTKNTGFPSKISEMSEYIVSLEYLESEETKQGLRNVALESWLHSSETPTKSNRQYEIMVWLNKSDGFRPGGDYRKIVKIDGELYWLCTGPFPEWYYIAFVKFKPVNSTTLRWNSFIEYLVSEDIIASDTYISDIEFGTEIIEGSGEFTLLKYEIDRR